MSGEFCFAMDELYTFELAQKPGEHVYANLTKLLMPKDAILSQTQPGTQIEVRTASRQIIFAGMILGIQIDDNEHERLLVISAVSNSILLDKSIKDRVFQDVNISYQEILKLIDGELREDSAIAQFPSALKAASHEFLLEDKPIRNLLIQYAESDWEFITRVASHFEQMLFDIPTKASCQYTVGIPVGKDITIQNLEKHDVFKSIDLVGHPLPDSYPNSAKFHEMRISYRLTYESDIPVSVGDRLKIDNETLYVREFRSFLDSGVLSHEICCVKKEGFSVPKKGNPNILGQSLRAVVKEVQHDTLLVQFAIEKEQSKQMLPFVYVTPYSAGKSTGFYFMPEVGDTVFLRFPSSEEKDAFGDGSIRVEEEGKESQTGDPKVKYIRTAAGKEIMFSETAIKISMQDKDGNEMHILIDDENGIEIKTEKPVKIVSEELISLSAKKNIELSADEIKLKGKDCEVILASALNLKGEVKMG